MAEDLLGEMMDYPLTLHHMFKKNASLYTSKTVTSFMDGEEHNYTYGG
jgi:hypothetical protein